MKHSTLLFLSVLLSVCGCKQLNYISTIDQEIERADFGNNTPVQLDKEYKTASYDEIPLCSKIICDTLDNGLIYYIQGNDRFSHFKDGKIDLKLVQKTGSLVEDDSVAGVAHFLEHMAFQGTEHFPGMLVIDFLTKNGLGFGNDFNARTSHLATIQYRRHTIRQQEYCRQLSADTQGLGLGAQPHGQQPRERALCHH